MLKNVSKQIVLSMQHDCLPYDPACSECSDLGYKKALQFIQALTGLRGLLATDVRAGFKGETAAKSYDEIISNATILGEETVIGAGSTIGGNLWIIDERVPPDTKVVLKKPELIYSGYNCKQSSRPQEEKPTIHFPEDTKVAG